MEKTLKHNIQSWHEPWGRNQKEEMCFSYFKEAEEAFQCLDIFSRREWKPSKQHLFMISVRGNVVTSAEYPQFLCVPLRN